MATGEQVLALAVLLTVTGCVLPLVRAGRPGLLALAWAGLTGVVTTVWFLHKAPYEGPVIISVTATRGLTVVDMIVVPGLAVAVAVAWRWRRGRH